MEKSTRKELCCKVTWDVSSAIYICHKIEFSLVVAFSCIKAPVFSPRHHNNVPKNSQDWTKKTSRKCLHFECHGIYFELLGKQDNIQNHDDCFFGAVELWTNKSWRQRAKIQQTIHRVRLTRHQEIFICFPMSNLKGLRKSMNGIADHEQKGIISAMVSLKSSICNFIANLIILPDGIYSKKCIIIKWFSCCIGVFRLRKISHREFINEFRKAQLNIPNQ